MPSLSAGAHVLRSNIIFYRLLRQLGVEIGVGGGIPWRPTRNALRTYHCVVNQGPPTNPLMRYIRYYRSTLCFVYELWGHRGEEACQISVYLSLWGRSSFWLDILNSISQRHALKHICTHIFKQLILRYVIGVCPCSENIRFPTIKPRFESIYGGFFKKCLDAIGVWRRS